MTYNPMRRGQMSKCKRCESTIKSNDTRLWHEDGPPGKQVVCAPCAKRDGWQETEPPKRFDNNSNSNIEQKLDRLLEMMERIQDRLAQGVFE
jgi:hypothetical protein